MPIPWELAACFVVGLALIVLIGRLLLTPRRFLWRLAASGVVGVLSLIGINALQGVTGFSVSINPFTAIAVGALGVPGVLLLVALTYWR